MIIRSSAQLANHGKMLFRLYRCIFQLVLEGTKNVDSQMENSTSTSDISLDTAEEALDQAMVSLREMNDPHKQEALRGTSVDASHVSNDELEWLSIVVFNHALDLYLDTSDKSCVRWARKAIELARLISCDERTPRLADLLSGRLRGLVDSEAE
jgi:hypothetical protein